MTQEEKELLIKDLSARLPYGVVCAGITYTLDDDGERYVPIKVKNTLTEIHNYKLETACVELGLLSSCELETVIPYLRPMSSMTEEEVAEYKAFHCVAYEHTYFYPQFCTVKNELNMFDWLNAHHFDYRNLIGKGLALEAPEGMYN